MAMRALQAATARGMSTPNLRAAASAAGIGWPAAAQRIVQPNTAFAERSPQPQNSGGLRFACLNRRNAWLSHLGDLEPLVKVRVPAVLGEPKHVERRDDQHGRLVRHRGLDEGASSVVAWVVLTVVA